MLGRAAAECTHEETYNGLCAYCGTLVSSSSGSSGGAASNSVKMTHGVAISSARAAEVQREAEEALLRFRKLALVLDLDETLVSTCHEVLAPEAVADAAPGSCVVFGAEAHRIECRPHLNDFLTTMSKYFELHLYTFGNVDYAREVLRIIDANGSFFHHRVIARENRPDESLVVTLPDPDGIGAQAEILALKQIIPTMGGLATTLVVDDRADVWNSIPNLIQIEPCVFPSLLPFPKKVPLHSPPPCLTHPFS